MSCHIVLTSDASYNHERDFVYVKMAICSRKIVLSSRATFWCSLRRMRLQVKPIVRCLVSTVEVRTSRGSELCGHNFFICFKSSSMIFSYISRLSLSPSTPFVTSHTVQIPTYRYPNHHTPPRRQSHISSKYRSTNIHIHHERRGQRTSSAPSSHPHKPTAKHSRKSPPIPRRLA